ncbi:MAG: adenylate cyclase, partial [Ornithinimicrobium sp.]
MTVHGEVEATYEAALDLDLLSVLTKALDGTPGLTLTAEPEQRSLDATYFDTGDLHLAGVGITLRRRTGGADAGWHLKIPHGPDEKVEKHLSLAAARHRVPAQLRRLVQAHT